MQNRKVYSAKLNYIRNNPCVADLCGIQEEYKHSSAKFYFTGEQGIYPVTSFMELRDIDLIK
jgi:hypothetical protein